MALLTFTGSVAKGTAKPMTLNKSSLTAAITAVTSDAYWTDTDHIARAVVYYESSGGQQKRLTYDFTQASPTADLLISSKGRNEWRVTKVQLFNFDGGSLTIPEAVLQAQVSGGISGLNLSLGVSEGSYLASLVQQPGDTVGFWPDTFSHPYALGGATFIAQTSGLLKSIKVFLAFDTAVRAGSVASYGLVDVYSYGGSTTGTFDIRLAGPNGTILEDCSGTVTLQNLATGGDYTEVEFVFNSLVSLTAGTKYFFWHTLPTGAAGIKFKARSGGDGDPDTAVYNAGLSPNDTSAIYFKAVMFDGVNVSGLATSLSFYGTGSTPSLPANAASVATANTLSYYINNGVMNLQYDLVYPGPAQSAGSGFFGIELPSGYQFAPSVTENQVLGTGLLGNSFSTTGIAATFKASGTNRVMGFFNSAGQWSDSVGGFYFGNYMIIKMTLTIPVVAV